MIRKAKPLIFRLAVLVITVFAMLYAVSRAHTGWFSKELEHIPQVYFGTWVNTTLDSAAIGLKVQENLIALIFEDKSIQRCRPTRIRRTNKHSVFVDCDPELARRRVRNFNYILNSNYRIKDIEWEISLTEDLVSIKLQERFDPFTRGWHTVGFEWVRF